MFQISNLIVNSDGGCKKPDDVANANVSGHSYGVNDTREYTCNIRFFLETGDLKRTCQSDKEWSGKPPVCRSV